MIRDLAAAIGEQTRDDHLFVRGSTPAHSSIANICANVMKAGRLRGRWRERGPRIQKRRKGSRMASTSDQTARYQILSGGDEICYGEKAREARWSGAATAGKEHRSQPMRGRDIVCACRSGSPPSTSVRFASTRTS